MRHKSRMFLGAVVALVVLLAAVTALASIPAGTQFLPGDNFEIDGNKPVNTAGNTDWANAPSLVTDPDLTKSTSDNSFGQGTKENSPVPTVVSGQIPPNKSDFSEFQESHRTASNGDTLVYLDWTRSNVLGSADMDFELNQSDTLSSNGVTAERTQGDLLITYDFANGGNSVMIRTATWNGNATSGSWSALTTLTSTQAVGSIADSLLFGELAIDLNAAGIFQAGICESFSSSYLKSRASDSFTSELKDFVAPRPVNIHNCGTVNIHKQDDLGAPLSGAVFTLYKDNAPIGGSRGAEDTITTKTCTTGDDGNCSIINVLFGDYWAVETTGVPNHDLAADQHVHLDSSTPDLTVSLTFIDPRQPGAIAITKTSIKGNAALANATFSITDPGGNVVGGGTTDANGHVCVGGLTLGVTYTVTETAAPTGYAIDTASKDVSVDHTSSCTTGTPNAVSFTDTPLSSITVSFLSEAGPGVTSATVQCTGEDGTSLPPHTIQHLPPGTYTCTVVVDP
jgi:hypothetical protein